MNILLSLRKCIKIASTRYALTDAMISAVAIVNPPIHENFTEIPVIEERPYMYKDNEPPVEKEETV